MRMWWIRSRNSCGCTKSIQPSLILREKSVGGDCFCPDICWLWCFRSLSLTNYSHRLYKWRFYAVYLLVIVDTRNTDILATSYSTSSSESEKSWQIWGMHHHCPHLPSHDLLDVDASKDVCSSLLHFVGGLLQKSCNFLSVLLNESPRSPWLSLDSSRALSRDNISSLWESSLRLCPRCSNCQHWPSKTRENGQGWAKFLPPGPDTLGTDVETFISYSYRWKFWGWQKPKFDVIIKKVSVSV